MSACTDAFSFSDYWFFNQHTDSGFASTSYLHREGRHTTPPKKDTIKVGAKDNITVIIMIATLIHCD